MRLAELADLRVAVWGHGREGRAALAALQRRFPGKALALFCSETEAQAMQTPSAQERFPRKPLALPASEIEAQELPSVSSPPQSQEKAGVAGQAPRANAASINTAAHSQVIPRAGAAASDSLLDIIATPPDAAALARFDVVIKSPGISPYRAAHAQAAALGVRFVSGSALWFAEHAQARTICVTGTKGKSTVTALIAHLLRKSGRRVALAGNIGLPLLELLDVGDEDASAPDWWVIELSSFQTRDFDGAPDVAVINNVYEEHLDWHLSRENYVADKLAIAARARHVVVNAEQTLLAGVGGAGGRSEFNSSRGWHVRDAAICRGDARILALASIPLPGLHNAQNVCAALAALEAAGVFESDPEPPSAAAGDQTRAERFAALAAHVATFEPLPHRLQTLGLRDAITYVNDSISTTPYAAIEALRSLAGQAVTILVGGFDRGVSWQPFAEYVAAHPPRAVVAMGANREAIAVALRAIVPQRFVFDSAPLLADAFARARAVTPAGGAMLLSPGAPSFDQFHDYAERGREFARLAGFDPNAIAQIEGLGIA